MSTTERIQLLVTRLKAGERSAIDVLFEDVKARCRHIAGRMLEEWPAAERRGTEVSVIQDAALRLAQTVEDRPPENALEFFRLAAETVRHYLVDLTKAYRSLSHDTLRLPADTVPYNEESWNRNRSQKAATTDGAQRLVTWTCLHDAAARLPENLRDVFDLIFYNGMALVETEGLLGCDTTTIRKRWIFARLHLQRACDLQTDSMALSPRVQDLLVVWEDLYRAGQNVPAEELCKETRLAKELQEEIDRLIRMNELLGDPTRDDSFPEDARQAIETEPTSLSTTSTYTSAVLHSSGGRGEVWKAEQVELQRSVALKLLKRNVPKDPELKTRFQFEARATSQLDHPGVAPVYAVGETANGLPFYAMRFISGSTLDSEIDNFHETDWPGESRGNRRRALHALLRHLVSAAKTIAYAHKRSILNLDIKPLNIMVGKYGETLVVDWGEALPIDDPRLSVLQTEGPLPVTRKDGNREVGSSSVGGTLPYMAPERIPGSHDLIGPATDIYSLGASLYQLLTGTEPFAQGSPSRNDVLQRIWQQEMIRPSDLNADAEVPRALEAICLKAMAFEPSERYATALEFAKDIERWLDDEPVKAHGESSVERWGRWLRRHQTSTWVIGASLVSVIALLGLMSLFLGRAWDNAEAARRQCLHLAAESTSRLVSRAFEERWLILEEAAERSEMHDSIAAAQQWLSQNGEIQLGDAPQQELQDHLLEVHDKWKTMSQAASMLVLNEEGIILARVPEEKNTKNIVGKNFRFRDYFHGEGTDYGEEEVSRDPPAPISQRHVSIPFRSKDNETLRVQFTVPVKAGSQTVAVLGAAVNIAQFEELRSKDTSHPLVLVDLRPTKIDTVSLPTLILHHPQMTKPGLHRLNDPKLLQQLQELLRIHRYGEPEQRVSDSWCADYIDPVVNGKWRCAIEPLRVRTARDNGREPLELVVLAQERVGKPERRMD